MHVWCWLPWTKSGNHICLCVTLGSVNHFSSWWAKRKLFFNYLCSSVSTNSKLYGNWFNWCPLGLNTLDIQILVILAGLFSDIGMVKLDPYYSRWLFWLIFLTMLQAPLVIPSWILPFIAISVLSPSANLRLERICFVFLGSFGICFMILSLSSAEFAPQFHL